MPIDTPCQRVSAPPPPHRSALEAYRGQLHVRAHALHSPCSVTSRPARRQTVLAKWRGWDSNPRSRAHEAREDSRSSTALRGTGRTVWPAGFEPAVSGSRNRRSGQAPLRARCTREDAPVTPSAVPPAGLEPAASGLRARRHRPSTTGACRSSGGRDRTCASRVTAARLAARPHRNETEAAGFEPADGEAVYALATRCHQPLGHASRAEGEGVEPSRPRSPAAFEAVYRANGSPSVVAPAGVEPAPHRLRDGGSSS